MADFDVNKRLKKIIEEHYKMSPFAFSQKYGDNRGVKTSAIIRERNGVSNNMLESIIGAYPEINRNWLLTGEGEMIKKPEPPTEAPAQNVSDNVSIPREAWEVIRDQAASLKAKDEQMNEMIAGFKEKDRQINDVIAMLKDQIKKGEDVGDQRHAAPGAVLG